MTQGKRSSLTQSFAFTSLLSTISHYLAIAESNLSQTNNIQSLQSTHQNVPNSPLHTMHLSKAWIVTVLLQTSIGLSAPIDDAASSPATSALYAFPQAATEVPEYQCPHSNGCGVVTYIGNRYMGFGTGVCMSLGNGIQSIYVNRCYCSLWR